MKLLVLPVVFAVCAPSEAHHRFEAQWAAVGSGVASDPGVDPGLHGDSESSGAVAVIGMVPQPNLGPTWEQNNPHMPMGQLALSGAQRAGEGVEFDLDAQIGLPGTRLRAQDAPAPSQIPSGRLTLDTRFRLTGGAKNQRVSVGLSLGPSVDVAVVRWRKDLDVWRVGPSQSSFTGGRSEELVSQETTHPVRPHAALGVRSGLWVEGELGEDDRLLAGTTFGAMPSVVGYRYTVSYCVAGEDCSVRAPGFTWTPVFHPWVGYDRRGEYSSTGFRLWGSVGQRQSVAGASLIVRWSKVQEQ